MSEFCPLDLITSQRSHLLIPLLRDQDFNNEILGGHIQTTADSYVHFTEDRSCVLEIYDDIGDCLTLIKMLLWENKDNPIKSGQNMTGGSLELLVVSRHMKKCLTLIVINEFEV